MPLTYRTFLQPMLDKLLTFIVQADASLHHTWWQLVARRFLSHGQSSVRRQSFDALFNSTHAHAVLAVLARRPVDTLRLIVDGASDWGLYGAMEPGTPVSAFGEALEEFVARFLASIVDLDARAEVVCRFVEVMAEQDWFLPMLYLSAG